MWAHFIPAITSPPWTNPEKSHLAAKFSFSTNYLSWELDPGMTIGKLEETLITENVNDWIILSTLFVLGIYSCWLIFVDSKYWPYLVFLLSAYISFVSIPPIVDLFNFHPTWGEHLSYVIGYIPRHASSIEELYRAYFSVMNIYVSPILFGGLFLYSFHEIIKRVKGVQIAA